MIDKSQVVRAYLDALARGARHEAQAVRARYALVTGDLGGEAFQADRPLVMATRRSGPEPPVAFLASFGARERDVIFPLKRGVTRVGIGPPFGDFDLEGPRPIESRQWLVVERAGEILVADDHSTNESLVLPRRLPKIAGTMDPRWERGVLYYSELRAGAGPGASLLDWPGTTVHALAEGDVIVTIYAPHVFGTMTPSN
jgi:hypothetical protein